MSEATGSSGTPPVESGPDESAAHVSWIAWVWVAVVALLMILTLIGL